MGPQLRRRTIAGVGASLMAPALALAGPTPAGAAPATAAAPAEDATAATHCNTASDYRLQLSAPLRSQQYANGDVVQLYYSPSTRCVYGKYLADNPCLTEYDPVCRARVVRHNADGTNTYTSWCNAHGDGICVTSRIHDAGAVAAAEAERANSRNWYGKTGWW